MCLLPILGMKIQEYIANRYKIPFQTTPKITTREYLKIKSKAEDTEFINIEGEQNLSLDLNLLIRNIVNKDKEIMIKEISAFNEQIWKLRLNAMPIGICIVGKDFRSKFMNRTLINMLMRNFMIENDKDKINSIFMNELQFKRIDHAGTYDWPQSALFKHERRSSGNVEEDKYCLRDLLIRIEDGSLDRFITDQIIELFSTFESPLNKKQIFLDCRVLFQEKESIDYMVTIQDFTKQNELSKLEEKNQFKTRVVQSFSHELRTPLNSATIFLRSAIMDPNLTKEIKIQYLQPCLSALKLQNNLINDIVDFSQISAQLLQLKFNTFTLQQIIDEITEQFKFQFEFKKIGLAFEICHPLLVTTQIKTDYQRLLQVLTNIIQNALTYTESGYVLLRIEPIDHTEIEITILDDGIGLTRRKLTQIHQVINYEQATSSSTTQQWQGFGLIICQMLLRYLSPINKNILKIDSDGLECGTKVSFIISNHIIPQTQEQTVGSSKRFIPRLKSMPILRAEYGLLISIKAKSQSKLLLKKTNIQEECDLSSPSVRGVPLKLNRYELKHTSIEILNNRSKTMVLNGKRLSNSRISIKETGSNLQCCTTILSVDDEVFNQNSLQLLLEQQNLTVDIVFNGRQAIERVQHPVKCSPNCPGYKLILMDCQMPIMDGWKATKKLRDMMQQQLIPKIPIIGLTAFTSNEDMEKCKEVGMQYILHKPLDIKKFQSILSELRII